MKPPTAKLPPNYRQCSQPPNRQPPICKGGGGGGGSGGSTASQTQLPFSNAPIDWTLPVECSFGQLRDVVAAAERAGFCAVRMACISGGYRVQFQRNHNATETQQCVSHCISGSSGYVQESGCPLAETPFKRKIK